VQEDAIHLVAARCGYSPQAVARAFQARYRNQPDGVNARSRPILARELER
jgi:hypothetical protein